MKDSRVKRVFFVEKRKFNNTNLDNRKRRVLGSVVVSNLTPLARLATRPGVNAKKCFFLGNKKKLQNSNGS